MPTLTVAGPDWAAARQSDNAPSTAKTLFFIDPPWDYGPFMRTGLMYCTIIIERVKPTVNARRPFLLYNSTCVTVRDLPAGRADRRMKSD
jgi:hypothetical protein